MKIEDLREEIKFKRDKARRDYKEYSKLSVNSYGSGAAWGEYECCNDILNIIDGKES